MPSSPVKGGTDARRRTGSAAVALGCLVLGVFAGGAANAPGASSDTLHRYAVDTWESMVAMTDPDSGLPTDILSTDGERAVQTSTTNIGAYMWSTVGAEELGIIDHEEAVSRLERTVSTLEGMERHPESGQFFNWYDHRTGEKITVWPPSGEPHEPRLSSVDNGWLATGLAVVSRSVPELADRTEAIYDSMDFGFYYVPERNQIMFHYEPRTGNVALLLRHDRQREPDRELHRHRQGRASAQTVFRGVPELHGHLRGPALAGDQAPRVRSRLLRRERVRGRLSVQGLRRQRHAGHAGVGREHVRGADAGAVPAGGRMGARELEVEPSAHRRGADPSRPPGGAVRVLGLLARERAGGRLSHLRGRRPRHGPERLSVQQRLDP